MKIAMIGTRGVPAKYGGFETCVDEVGRRLAAKGHDVTVYCRKSYYGKKERLHTFKGMKLVYLPNWQTKFLDTLSHTFFSICHSLFAGYDCYMVFNAANSILLLPLRLLGKKIIINTDGLEWKRAKWGNGGKFYYKISEILACFMANRLISDSSGIKRYYHKKYNVDSNEIAYGAKSQFSKDPDILTRFGLKRHSYFLQITRFEPENHPLLSVRAFNMLKTNKKLVIVGFTPYPTEYQRKIHREASKNVLLPGPIFDKNILQELWCNCFAYLHGNTVGGTNPALLQSMASGCFVIASDNPFNRAVLKNCGKYFLPEKTSLHNEMQWSLDNGHNLAQYRQEAQERIIKHYNWETVALQYEALFADVVQGRYTWYNNLSTFRFDLLN